MEQGEYNKNEKPKQFTNENRVTAQTFLEKHKWNAEVRTIYSK